MSPLPKRKSAKPLIGVVLLSLDSSGGTAIIFQYLKVLSESACISILVPKQYFNSITSRQAEMIDLFGWKIEKLENASSNFDLVILTFWKTVLFALRSNLSSREWLYFVQSLEDRFNANPKDFHSRPVYEAQSTYALNIPILTEAEWIYTALENRTGLDAGIHLARNPVLVDDSLEFLPLLSRTKSKVLRLVVEGNDNWFKSVKNTLEAVGNTSEGNFEVHIVGSNLDVKGDDRLKFINHGLISREEFLNLLKESHLLVKMSSVEGMYGPPLEGFCVGTPCITSNVTGSEEYISHCINSIVVEVGDFVSLTNWLDFLSHNISFLQRLSENALRKSLEWRECNSGSLAPALILSLVDRNLRSQTLDEYTTPRGPGWNEYSAVPLNKKRYSEVFKMLIFFEDHLPRFSYAMRLILKLEILELARKIKKFAFSKR